MGFILWLVGAICCIWCIKDVWAKPKLDKVLKLVISIALLCCSWLGLAVYYFIHKDRL